MKSHWKEPWAYPDKTCNRCGATGLHWVETDQGWKLYDGDEIHRCNRSEVKVNMKPLTQAGFLAMRDRAEKAEAEVERLHTFLLSLEPEDTHFETTFMGGFWYCADEAYEDWKKAQQKKEADGE